MTKRLLGVVALLLAVGCAPLRWREISSGFEHALGVKTDGTLWHWGFLDPFRIDAPKIPGSRVPVQVGKESDWRTVSASLHSIAIKKDGSLWSWGDNENGQLCLGETASWAPPERRYAGWPTPQRIGEARDWVAASAGLGHTLALKRDGTLWGCGDPDHPWYYGRLSPEMTVLRQIGTDNDWAQISAGRGYDLAVKKNGTLWSWGQNEKGVLGHGDDLSRPWPTQVGTESDWHMAAAGLSHSLALKRDGSLWSWGFNFHGQLGYGVYKGWMPSPHQVGAEKSWTWVENRNNRSLALKKDGSLWTWGADSRGSLGLGAVERVSAPTRIMPPERWRMVRAGEESTFALDSDGLLWGWGANQSSEVGDGSCGEMKPRPVRVLDGM